MRTHPTAKAKLITIAGTMSAVAAALQISAAFAPGPGHIASALATLPLALVAWISPGAGFASYVIAATLVLIMAPEECPIILTTTGPLGIVLGMAGAAKLCMPIQIFIGAAVLAGGMAALMFIFKINPLGPGMPGMGWIATIGIYLGFALLYAWAWALILRRVVPRLLAGYRNVE